MKKIIALFLVYLGMLSGVFAKDIRFIQVTDVRYSKTDDNGMLADFVKEVNSQNDVDFIVFAGNNINRPDIKNLEGFVKQAKKLNKPFYVLIGDKDVNKYKKLSKAEYVSYLRKKIRTPQKTTEFNYTFKKDGVVFMAVDGSRDIVPTSMGYYKEDVLNWVRNKLDKYKKKNIIIIQHYPLVSPDGSEVTFNPERYMELLESHNNVKAVVAGNKHISGEQVINGVTHISTAPFPIYRVIDIINCESTKPTIWAEIRELNK